MIISDLNTLELVDGSAVVGGFLAEGAGSTKFTYDIYASAIGHVATSQSKATATGYGTATETENTTSTTPYSSSSTGSAISVTSGSYYGYGW